MALKEENFYNRNYRIGRPWESFKYRETSGGEQEEWKQIFATMKHGLRKKFK